MDEYLIQPLEELTRLFEAKQIPYALMGGIAVAVHGIPRSTHAIDFTIQIERASLPELFAAAEDLGYTVPEVYSTGWVDQIAEMPVVTVRQWLNGKFVDVDIFLAESRFQRELMARQVRAEVDELPTWVVSAEDLILLKLTAARPRDIGDIYDILMAQGELDNDYMNHWAKELGVDKRLREVIEEFHRDNSGESI